MVRVRRGRWLGGRAAAIGLAGAVAIAACASACGGTEQASPGSGGGGGAGTAGAGGSVLDAGAEADVSAAPDAGPADAPDAGADAGPKDGSDTGKSPGDGTGDGTGEAAGDGGKDGDGGACEGGKTNCGGLCVSTDTDPANCGACGQGCAQGEACQAGKCTLVCAGGTTKCPGADGGAPVCVDTKKDPANCGDCNLACGAGETCANGQCTLSCVGGTTACGNVCVDTKVDPAHCGGCGQKCAYPNAVGLCVNGACALGACLNGFGNCDVKEDTGCEADLQTTLAHCGGCSNSCAPPANADPTCTGGACGFACKAGWGNCDGNAANGCETDTQSTVAHCGGCNQPCAPPANGTAGCSGGACTVASCNPNFGDCDGQATNGCESNLSTDAKNCGGCNKPCQGAAPCVGGACQCVPTGARAAFNSLVQDSATGPCLGGNPCQTSLYTPAASQFFAGYGQSITCGGTATCVAHVGITTYLNTLYCQGAWDVECNGTKVGTISTVGKACTGSSLTNGCSVTFAPRMCSTIRLISVTGTSPGVCCNGAKPDSRITSVSAW